MKWLIYLLLLANVGFFAWQAQDGLVPASSSAGPRYTGHQVEGLLLLSELPSAETVPVLEEAPSAQPATEVPAEKATDELAVAPELRWPEARSPEPETPPNCYTLGPFPEEQALVPLTDWLARQGGSYEERTSEERFPRTYWVYLPPFPTREAALEVVAQLRGDGVTDLMRVRQGSKVNAISLGLFSRRPLAEQRLQDLKDRGYSPRLDTRYGTARVRWLDVQVPADVSLSPEDFERLSAGAGELAKAPCP